MKNVKVEWCRNFIRAAFEKIPFENGGIEVGCFWDMAERSGLWQRGTYGTPMSDALEDLTKVETVSGKNGEYLYSVFRLVRREEIMTLEKIYEMGLIKDDTEIWIRRVAGFHDPRIVAHGNWYQDRILDYMQKAVKSFIWQDNNTLVIDIT